MATSTKKLPWYQRHENDTGSPEYQIYQITQKIADLQKHLNDNHKDYPAKRSLLKLVARRRQHVKYLKNNDIEKYDLVRKKMSLK